MTRVEEILKEKARYNAFFEKHIRDAYVNACVDYVEKNEDIVRELMELASSNVEKLYAKHLIDLQKRADKRAAKKLTGGVNNAAVGD